MKKIGVGFLLVATPLLIGTGIYFFVQSSVRIHATTGATNQPTLPADRHWEELSRRVRYQIDHFPGISGVVIKDLRRGWIIEHNSEKLFPSASLVKIPIMASLYQAQTEGRVSLDEMIPLSRKMKTAGSGHLKNMRNGSQWTVRQLIYKMITESDNTATNMLTDLMGLGYYNSSFLRLGLSHTNMARTIMDLRQRNRGVENYTTPRDMAKILEMIYLRKITGADEMMETLKDQKVNDRLPAALPTEWQIGHKTGLMNKTVHDVGIVFSPTSDYVICVLTSNVNSIRRAKHFISAVAYQTAIYYGNPNLFETDKSYWTKNWRPRRFRDVSRTAEVSSARKS